MPELIGSPTALTAAPMRFRVADRQPETRLHPGFATLLIVGLSVLGWMVVWRIIAWATWAIF
jgi:hypothetical protein